MTWGAGFPSYTIIYMQVGNFEAVAICEQGHTKRMPLFISVRKAPTTVVALLVPVPSGAAPACHPGAAAAAV